MLQVAKIREECKWNSSRPSDLFCLRFYYPEVPGRQVLKFVPFFVDGCFGFWNLHRVFWSDGDVLFRQCDSYVFDEVSPPPLEVRMPEHEISSGSSESSAVFVIDRLF